MRVQQHVQPIIKRPEIVFKPTYWEHALTVRLLLPNCYNLKNVYCLWPFILVKLL